MNADNRSGLLAVGNWIIDHVKIVDHYPSEEGLAFVVDEYVSNGGGPYNVLKNLSKMKAPFALSGSGIVGDDDYGRFIREDCAANGIDASRIRISTEAATSYTDVMTTRSSGRRTFFHQKGTNALLDLENLDIGASTARLLHHGYLLLLDTLDRRREGGLTGSALLLKQAQEFGYKTSVDLVTSDSGVYGDVVPPALPFMNYLFLNEVEAQGVTGMVTRKDDEINIDAVVAATERLIEAGVNDWVFCHFPEGVVARNANGAHLIQGNVRLPEEEIVGAVGAGDAFAAGVLLGLHEEWNISDALKLGACAAAACLSHPTSSEGLRPHTECLQLGERYGYRSLDL